jgi:hypothetical protein
VGDGDDKRPPPGRFNVRFGDVSQSQVVMGDHNTVSQHVGLTAAELAELQAVFSGLKATVESDAPPGLRDVALSQAGELQRSITGPQPDPRRVRDVLRWFRDHVPQLVGAVVSVVVHPLVGKAVEGAGEAVAAQFRELVEAQL